MHLKTFVATALALALVGPAVAAPSGAISSNNATSPLLTETVNEFSRFVGTGQPSPAHKEVVKRYGESRTLGITGNLLHQPSEPHWENVVVNGLQGDLYFHESTALIWRSRELSAQVLAAQKEIFVKTYGQPTRTDKAGAMTWAAPGHLTMQLSNLEPYPDGTQIELRLSVPRESR